MSECVHDFEIGSRYCVHCGQGAAELLYHAKARIAELEYALELVASGELMYPDVSARQALQEQEK